MMELSTRLTGLLRERAQLVDSSNSLSSMNTKGECSIKFSTMSGQLSFLYGKHSIDIVKRVIQSRIAARLQEIDAILQQAERMLVQCPLLLDASNAEN